MKTFLRTWWERLRASYWFMPTLLAVAAIALSVLTLHIDTTLNPKWARSSAWVWAGGAEGARNVLATIASSTITVAGVVFSITIVTLTLASSQFGPRLLRNFMDDTGTQLVLGVFVATYLYCLLVLRAIRGTDEVTLVPYLSVTCGVVFAVVSVGFLIYFIHHISTSIIAENVVARVAIDLRANIDQLFPKVLKPGSDGTSDPEAEEPPEFAEECDVITSDRSGFIQAIAMENFVELAGQQGVILRIKRRPGDFVAEGAPIADVIPAGKVDPEALRNKILSHVFFGPSRTPTQDVEYSIDQLVEVAVRALSPGVNDPFTAMTCIEWLGAALIQVAGREIPSRWRYDKDGQLRVLADTTSFAGIAAAALNQVRQYGAGSVAVTIRLLEMIGRVGPHLVRRNDGVILLEHALTIRDDGIAAAVNERDRRDIEDRFRAAKETLRVESRDGEAP